MKETKPSAQSSFVEMAVLGQLWDQYRPRLLAMPERRLDAALAARIGPDEPVLQTAALSRHVISWRRRPLLTPVAATKWLSWPNRLATKSLL